MVKDTKFGVNLWWTVPEVAIDANLAQAILVKHGFKATDLKIPSRRVEVSRAAYSLQNRRGKTNRTITERAGDNGVHVAYGILDRKQEGEVVGFEQNTKVTMNKDTGAVTVEGNRADAFTAALSEYEGKIVDADVRMFLRNVVRICFGVAKRPTGGIYFVPAKFTGIVESAQAVLNELGTSARLYVERVVDGVEERQNVWEAVASSLDEEIDKVLANVELIDKRASALKGQQQKLEELNELVAIYQQLLGEEAKHQEAAEKIEAAVRVVTDKMSQFDAVPTTPVVAEAGATEEVKEAVKVGGSVVEAAVTILKEMGTPMGARELTDEAIKRGLYASTGKNPYNLFNSSLLRAIKKGDKRVAKVGMAKYAVVA